MKKVLALLMAAAMILSLAACGNKNPDSNDDSNDKKTALILGTSADYAPFEFMYPDDKGELTYAGIDVSVAQYIADDMGLSLQVENMAFEYLLTSLGKGDFDMVLAAMEATPDRLENADFSDPYYNDIPPAILVKADKADQFKTLADFAGKSVGAQAATTKLDIIADSMPGANAVSLQSVLDLINDLTYDKVDAVLERVAAIRESCGKYFGIAIDFHGRVHKPMAKVLAKKLEEFDPMFIEEPVLCENMEVFKEIAAACNVPIATGERLFTKYDFKRLLQAGGVDIIQPDLSHAGGLTEVKKIASMAEAYDVALAPHCPLGPIALASCLNVDATCYNAVIQEQSIGIHYNVGKSVLDYVKNQDDFKFVDGRVQLPVRPGLGVDVNKELVLEENKTPHEWKNPVWRHKDGSVAEW